MLKPPLRKNLVFALHNPVTDSSLNVFNVVICRNSFALFNELLQEKVLRLIRESLAMVGFPALGSKDPFPAGLSEPSFERVLPRRSLYRRIQ